jgi:hypothetical protein
MSKWSPAKKGS